MARVSIQYPRHTLFEIDIAIRITDLNYGNHLAHDTLISILHEARARFLIAEHMSETDVDGCILLVADLAVRYKSESHYGAVLQVSIAAGDIDPKSCDLIYRVKNAKTGRLVALAKTGLVFKNPLQNTVAPVPQRLLDIFQQKEDAPRSDKT